MRKASKLLCLRAFYESAGLFLFAPSGARGTAKTPSWGREIFLAYRLPAYARNGNFFQNRIKAEAVQLL
ncbi:MAG: hypothetical protein HYS74_02800 [Parcubacteria group bacterium]|nr:hypothetical protein [Parcubacteria group bacterium]